MRTNQELADTERVLAMYRMMFRIRVFEEEVIRLNQKQMIPGFIHSYIGEEASAVGACSAIEPDDRIVSTHRGHGHIIAKGCDIRFAMAELFGKSSGYCKGKGGSMHIADIHHGVIGANGIVGGGLPIACGAGLAAQLDGRSRVVLCFFGDGASNQGSFHESLNLASIWDLPIVFICENNLYALSVAQRDHQRVESVSERAGSYRMPGTSMDGNDVLAVYAAVRQAVELARKGEGPSLLEARTYRWRGHSEADPIYGTRTKEEVETWKQKCPIRRLRLRLLGDRSVEEKQILEIETGVRKEVDDAIRFGRESPLPSAETALNDVFYGS
jgi:pyruvate dehydrogenase E1 component alpha subunit